ncbi:MAG TPA: hypothetical protein VE242_04625 [Chthoniobacterales bacterium]|nr:hypothetical protein [Chthoniobacterales bacterium]
MKKYFANSLILFFCLAEWAASADITIPKLPDLYVFRYIAQGRDPLISAEAKQTLVSGGIDLGTSFTTKAAQQYLDTIIQAIKKELFVQGVSTGDAATRGVALINGVVFTQGEKIPLTIGQNELLQLEELAKTYGLPLEKTGGGKESIFVEVGEIQTTGVTLLLPGFKSALCKLPYRGDYVPERIQLERKKPSADHDE